MLICNRGGLWVKNVNLSILVNSVITQLEDKDNVKITRDQVVM